MYKNKYNPIKVIVKIPSRERKIVSSLILLSFGLIMVNPHKLVYNVNNSESINIFFK